MFYFPSFNILEWIEYIRMALNLWGMQVFMLVENHFLSLISSRSIRKLKARITKKRKGGRIWFLCSESSYHLHFKKIIFFPTTPNLRIYNPLKTGALFDFSFCQYLVQCFIQVFSSDVIIKANTWPCQALISVV